MLAVIVPVSAASIGLSEGLDRLKIAMGGHARVAEEESKLKKACRKAQIAGLYMHVSAYILILNSRPLWISSSFS